MNAEKMASETEDREQDFKNNIKKKIGSIVE